MGGRPLLGQIPWACALCQGALSEPLRGAQRSLDAAPHVPDHWASSGLGVSTWGAEEIWGVLQSLGPRQRLRGLGRRKGKGDVIAAWNLLFGGVVMETGRLRVGKNSKPKRV